MNSKDKKWRDIYERQSDVATGTGIFSMTPTACSVVLMSEAPSLCLPLVASRNRFPLCSSCMTLLVDYVILLGDIITPPTRGRAEYPISEDMTVPGIRCSTCEDETRGSLLPSHAQDVCDHLEVTYSPALVLALRYCSILQSGNPLESVAEALRPDRFCAIPNEAVRRAFDLATSLFGPVVDFEYFHNLVKLFENCNLVISIEPPEILSLLSAGAVSSGMMDSLSRAHSICPFPSLADDDPSVPHFPIITGYGFYPTIAKINHSCEPNTEWQFVDGTPRIDLVALRDIQEGGELTISYIDQDLPIEERQAILRERYGFECRCSKCKLD